MYITIFGSLLTIISRVWHSIISECMVNKHGFWHPGSLLSVPTTKNLILLHHRIGPRILASKVDPALLNYIYKTRFDIHSELFHFTPCMRGDRMEIKNKNAVAGVLGLIPPPKKKLQGCLCWTLAIATTDVVISWWQNLLWLSVWDITWLGGLVGHLAKWPDPLIWVTNGSLNQVPYKLSSCFGAKSVFFFQIVHSAEWLERHLVKWSPGLIMTLSNSITFKMTAY